MQSDKKVRHVRDTAYTEGEIEEIFRRFSVERPNPQSDLKYTNPYTLLVAVVLSAQVTDAGVNKATKPLFEIADTPEKMVALGEEELGRYIRTIGLWRNKAKNIITLSQILIRNNHGQVPDSREALMELPGVGQKTANVILNIAFHQLTMAVDTHIFRLANRLKLATGKTPEKVEKKLLQIIPSHYLLHAHHWLILHGRYICKARKSECQNCIISDLCKVAIKTNKLS
ncbi:MAG: endonuclease III [Candidatus Tokpelaia sp. JSC189]|nr:MAG: endonuclease III [Candidatus Tokpelaia sp. JSC189]